jgi:hypothetical protein
MKTFIANFGRENYLWPACHARSTVATLEDEDLRPLWLAGDRGAYINHCIATKKTTTGITPPAFVASRWFNITEIITSTENDLWLHREKNEFWWTISRPGEVEVSLEPAFKPANPGERSFILHKPAEPWSNKTKRGTRLEWPGLHPKAREFLFTEGTLQELSPDNAAYAAVLIEGGDLSPWHSRPDWRAKENSAKKGPVTIFDAKQRAIVRMAMTARDTASGANGQQVLRTVKNKEMRFATQQELERYLSALLGAQEGLCAITRIPLQYDAEHDDAELLCSLDRIDSAKHYEQGNLQIVCRFVNRWKNKDGDAEFRRLIDVVRGVRT